MSRWVAIMLFQVLLLVCMGMVVAFVLVWPIPRYAVAIFAFAWGFASLPLLVEVFAKCGKETP